MAIFYPHIKGGAVDSDASSKIKYSWIKFNGDGKNPQVYIGNTNSTDYQGNHAVDCGYLITSKITNTFDADQVITATKRLIFHSSSNNLAGSFSFMANSTDNTPSLALSYYNANNNEWAEYLALTNAALSVFKDLKVSEKIEIEKDLKVKGIANIDNGCNAMFFNATSDKRAKTDIRLLQTNALDLIDKVRIYSFEYKDTCKPSIGVIAQELQDIDIQGFGLVDNIYASGENGDYMRVKETKLIYILWKGIQELNEEVKRLRFEVDKLKHER